MYELILKSHNYLRWMVIALALITIMKYIAGRINKKPFTTTEHKLSLFYSIALDIQLLTGLLLYFFLSPITSSFKIDMKDPVSRFYGMEHFAMMMIAVILVHAGRVMVKKASSETQQYNRGIFFYLLSILIILASIPWPFRELIGRPLF